MLWNDIEWPDSGKRGGPQSLHRLFTDYYAAVPDGVVNDRWGATHHDFVTSEYEHNRHVEGGEPWENNRGIGFSFGYNRAEDESRALDGPALTRYLTDVVSRGGRLLLDVGPDLLAKTFADGIRKNYRDDALEALKPRMEAFDAQIRALPATIRKGEEIDLDFQPASGTRVLVGGKPIGDAIPGDDFYVALLKMFIGERAVDKSLRQALLGTTGS